MRRLEPEDWKVFRTIRLAALKEAPYAFGSTWEGEINRSDEDWRQAVTSRLRFVAVLDDQVVGMAAGGESNVTGTAALTSLWVDPGARGRGVGDRLVTAVLEWAKAEGFSQVLLWVTEGNSRAESLYRRNGFSRSGDEITEPLREFEMSVRI
ncbi:MAG TPA: GNAT family N-acetyltransferase [Candidatus Dormibacteraeota bacterium]|nr:GNAT family N-acetyltransferase [Candidatus Dormibacteraeota bacterium]